MDEPSSLQINELRVGVREHELAATIALVRAAIVPAAKLGSLIDEVGSAVRLVQLSEADRLFVSPDASHEVIGAVTVEDIHKALLDASDWSAREFDIRSVLDATYPPDLHEIFNRPALLFVRGVWPPPLPIPSIAIVGTRKPSVAGIARARRLATELVDAGFVVVSGLAAGIDTVAHSAALAAGGLTSAVLGTGLDRTFPPENTALAQRIIESGGALLSQFFPAQPPARWTFPMRNVVMSGLSQATVVVEAGATSGARLQARVALQHGRTVFFLRSLVEEHEWAAKYVNDGAYGAYAFEISSTTDILDRLSAAKAMPPLAVA
jgi:DNA processing protein